MKNRHFWSGMLVGGIVMMLISILGVKAFYRAYPAGTGGGGSAYSSEKAEILEKIDLLEEYIDNYYLFEDRYSGESVKEGIYKGIFESLDDVYSVYYTPEEFSALMDSNAGSYSGIGCYVSQNVSTGIITLTQPMKNSPSEKAGVQPGDLLYAVDGTEVTGMDVDQVVMMVKGEKGSEVVLTVSREGEPDLIDITVVRDTVEVDTVEYEMLDGKIGYIKIVEFDKITITQFNDAVDELEKAGMKGLVVDVRSNPGGDLDAVMSVLNRLLPEGPVLTVVNKNGEKTEYTTDDKEQIHVPLAVLTNENSASASEVFAGAIKDREAGIIVGTNTFGKGIVQSIIPLGDGSAIKITTEEFFTPSNNTIHGVGIAPDVEVELKEELKTLTEVPKEEDNQLQAAVKAITE